jgi:hypothetical protein
LNAREDALNDTYDDGEADSLESSDEETSSSEESSSTEDATESRNKQNNARGA